MPTLEYKRSEESANRRDDRRTVVAFILLIPLLLLSFGGCCLSWGGVYAIPGDSPDQYSALLFWIMLLTGPVNWLALRVCFLLLAICNSVPDAKKPLWPVWLAWGSFITYDGTIYLIARLSNFI
jgi:hypothetical protein